MIGAACSSRSVVDRRETEQEPMSKWSGVARVTQLSSCAAPILVVDDDEGMRVPLCRVLEFDGHRTVQASDGREGLRLLRDGLDPCLIIMDLMMPEVDGFAFRAAQVADPRLADIPTIVLTASALTTGTNALHATMVVTKPVTVDRVLALVDAYCRQQIA
jgi:CheY-like chemotaxis protein